LPLAFNLVLCFDTACRGAGTYVTAVLIVICAARFESVGSGADCARIVAFYCSEHGLLEEMLKAIFCFDY